MAESIPGGLLKEIAAAFENNPHINQHKHPVSLRDENGKLVLEGAVEDIAAKRSAVNMTYRIFKGRWPLRDRIRVISGEDRDDRDLRDEIIDVLGREPAFADYTMRTKVHGETETVHDAGSDASVIQAAVDNGVVTLTGRVESLTHRCLAEVLAWWTMGCRNVDNRLELGHADDDNDNELTDAVRLVLEKDPLVHAGQFSVGTAGGVIQVSGFAATEEEKRLALRDIWYVPGVWDVIDDISLRSP